LLRGLDLDRLIEVVRKRYGVDPGQLAARRSRLRITCPRRPGLPGKLYSECTRAELVSILGLSRPESVPNLSARFHSLLESEPTANCDLKALEISLGLRDPNSKSV
jgi:hypothetical protein